MIHSRPVEDPEDIGLVRDFLVRLWPLAHAGTVWEVRRWDGSIFHNALPGLGPERAARSRLWLDERGRIVAAALSEGDAQIHPHVTPEGARLLEEVVAWAEQAAAAAGDEHVLLTVWEHDEATRHVALARGYRATARQETTRLLHVGAPPPAQVAAGYVLRTTVDDPADHQGIADLLNAAFGRTSHTAAELANFTRLAPSFRRETDLVVAAPDGALVAYAAVCWDTANRHAIFEPVCTHPAHRQRGLARALMLEGIRRAGELGAAVIQVGTGDADPANAFYESLPFDEAHRGVLWERPLATRHGCAAAC